MLGIRLRGFQRVACDMRSVCTCVQHGGSPKIVGEASSVRHSAGAYTDAKHREVASPLPGSGLRLKRTTQEACREWILGAPDDAKHLGAKQKAVQLRHLAQTSIGRKQVVHDQLRHSAAKISRAAGPDVNRCFAAAFAGARSWKSAAASRRLGSSSFFHCGRRVRFEQFGKLIRRHGLAEIETLKFVAGPPKKPGLEHDASIHGVYRGSMSISALCT
jgi:hypothetical protein